MNDGAVAGERAGEGSERFYATLPAHDSFAVVASHELYREAPGDWLVVITDIRGSTTAIERGRYKDVNLVGASTIVALLNAAGGAELPYVFGGDGATLLLPPGLCGRARAALAGTRRMARAEFGLELRVGIVPVAHLQAAGASVRVARVRVSGDYCQAMFTGGGISHAEGLIKNPATAPEYMLPADEPGEADFSGLECRWQDISSRTGEVHSILVVARSHDPTAAGAVYREVLAAVDAIYGSAEEQHPLAGAPLRLSFNPSRLAGEARIRERRPGAWARLRYLLGALVANLLGAWLFATRAVAFGTDWGKYLRELRANTDYRKFDDALRMTLAGDAARRERLRAFLDERRALGQLAYGIHANPKSMLTCLVFSRQGNHVHFLDGSAGGYAMAAKTLKAQLKG
jgi:hypothetical protein